MYSTVLVQLTVFFCGVLGRERVYGSTLWYKPLHTTVHWLDNLLFTRVHHMLLGLYTPKTQAPLGNNIILSTKRIEWRCINDTISSLCHLSHSIFFAYGTEPLPSHVWQVRINPLFLFRYLEAKMWKEYIVVCWCFGCPSIRDMSALDKTACNC